MKCRDRDQTCAEGRPPRLTVTAVYFLKRGTSTQIKPLFSLIHTHKCGLLHWLEFMTLPLQAVYLAYVPGALAAYVSSYFLLHTHSCHVQAWINMYTCAHTQTHVHSSSRLCTSCFLTALCRDVALWNIRLLTHTATLGRRVGCVNEQALCWTELSPPREAHLPVRPSPCSLSPG